MYFVVGALVLLAAVPNLAKTCAPNTTKVALNLTNVVEECYAKSDLTCADLLKFLRAVLKGVVGRDRSALCFLACTDVDSRAMIPGRPFDLSIYNQWFSEEQWAALDPDVTYCSSGANMYIKDVCDREYDFMKCMIAVNSTEALSPLIPPVPSACK